MISICTLSPNDFSDNAVYVVRYVLHIEQWYPFVTLLNLWKEHSVYCSCVSSSGDLKAVQAALLKAWAAELSVDTSVLEAFYSSIRMEILMFSCCSSTLYTCHNFATE